MSGAVVAMVGRFHSVIPNPTPDWANISAGTGPTPNADVTISGISEAIQLLFNVTDNSGTSHINWFLNGANQLAITDGALLTVNPGDLVHFSGTAQSGAFNSTVTIKNHASGDTTLDTFTVILTG